MNVQIIKNAKGENNGVFIPEDDWQMIKANFPGIENLGKEIPDWQKEILDERLAKLEANSEAALAIEDFFND